MNGFYCVQGFSQDLETGCPKLAIVKFWGIQIFKGDHNRGLAVMRPACHLDTQNTFFLTVWTPKSLCQNLLKMTFLRR